MGLQEGKEGEDQSPNNENDAIKQLTESLRIMQNELAALREAKSAPAQQSPGGFSPEQWAEFIATVSKATKDRPDSDSLTMKKFVEERDIDPADYDKEGVLFCAYGTGYPIVDDVRNGFPVSTPFHNVIYFQYAGTKRGTRNADGYEELSTFCTYISHSKKEQEWLRQHRFFGLKFFESHVEALSANAEYAQRLVRYIDSLMSQDQDQVLKQCQSYGVPISTDMRNMRIMLAQKMAQAQGDQARKMSEARAQENLEEDLFLKSGTTTTSEKLGRKS
jgi:hypothetical protein